MKLLRTRIVNFRILKEIELNFSTSTEKPLTVIRAGNESGKTTLLFALQWGLYGDDGLPTKNFRISPFDESSGNRKVAIEISVEIDFEVSLRTDTAKYRLIRSVTETLQGPERIRGNTNIKLYRLTSTGSNSVDNAEVHIRPHLPKELREVFFTDGDTALGFIEGQGVSPQNNVESAIRSLLGLGVIEEALSHVQRVSSNINQSVRKSLGSGDELKTVTERLAALQKIIPDLEKEHHLEKASRVKLEVFENEADAKLSAALRKGNREELEKQRKASIQARKSAEKDSEEATAAHAELFRNELLGKQLLAEPFEKAKTILDQLYVQNKIPSQTIPVLEDRLNQPMCICGESLHENDPDGQKRREHIRHLIEDSRNTDEIQEKVTNLFYSAQDLLNPAEEGTWTDLYSEVFSRRQRANLRRKEHGEAETAVEAKISELPDIDIQELRKIRNEFRNQSKEAQNREIRLDAQLDQKRKELTAEEQKREGLLKTNDRGMKFVAELEVAKDLQDVLGTSLETMKTRELAKVSEQMNITFLDMIGAGGEDGEEQRSIIRRAEITENYRIVVYGSDEQPIDTVHALNGASRRALTIAFILALTKVSEVEAPNVIDTPLGMSSDYVRSAILQLAVQQSSQLVLFLTYDEILGCEDILDKHAGKVYTLTNVTHYPRILVNNPGINDERVVSCECDHRNSCKLCERRKSADINSPTNKTG